VNFDRDHRLKNNITQKKCKCRRLGELLGNYERVASAVARLVPTRKFEKQWSS